MRYKGGRSMSSERRFVSRAVSGEFDEDLQAAIDAEIDRWHDASSGSSLYEWLGLTRAEYQRWFEDPDVLASIVEERRRPLLEFRTALTLPAAEDLPFVGAFLADNDIQAESYTTYAGATCDASY
jgi:hypothetical protein